MHHTFQPQGPHQDNVKIAGTGQLTRKLLVLVTADHISIGTELSKYKEAKIHDM